MADICLQKLLRKAASSLLWLRTHVYFCIFEPLFEVFIDGLVRNRAQQCQVRDPDFLLLRAFENRLFNLGLPTSPSGCRIGSIFLPSSPFGDALGFRIVSESSGEH